jgi:hypothetical protein
MKTRLSIATALISLALVTCSAGLNAATPKGWRVAGSKPQEYDAGVEQVSVVFDVPVESGSGTGFPTAYLRCKRPTVEGFGTLMQNFPAGVYAGRRLRFTAFLRTDRVQYRAGLWMRIDTREFSKLANMEDQPVKGTTAWRRYGIVLDIPKDAHRISFGVLLAGSGTVWINQVAVDAMDIEHPDSAIQPVRGPVNLDFQQR